MVEASQPAFTTPAVMDEEVVGIDPDAAAHKTVFQCQTLDLLSQCSDRGRYVQVYCPTTAYPHRDNSLKVVGKETWGQELTFDPQSSQGLRNERHETHGFVKIGRELESW